jgi:8-oxo-dGTP pyrophosphatase MutT (NUDIX family)
MFTVTPISVLPDVVLVDPPVVPAAIDDFVASLHDRLLGEQDGYDSPAMLCRSWTPERVELYEGRYSQTLAFHELGPCALGAGPAAVRLLIDDGAGRFLWARRAYTLPDGGGRWSWSAAGGIDPGETVEQTVIREAVEELGLEADDLLGLRPLALLGGLGFAPLFQAQLRPGARFALNADEVAEVCWAPGIEALEPRSAVLDGLWPEVRRLVTAPVSRCGGGEASVRAAACS